MSRGKVVIDVGAGTGALSIMSAKAHASKVYAIEYSKIIESARKLLKDNGVLENVTLINDKAEEA